MLKIVFGDVENVIYNTSVFFKNQYREEWILSQKGMSMIQDIDDSKVLGNAAIESPVMGIIAPERLSGGVKTLLLIDNMPEKLFNASNCGDNCASWLLRIGEEKDVLINLRHIMDFGDDEFEIQIMNTNTIVHNMDELVRIAGRYV